MRITIAAVVAALAMVAVVSGAEGKLRETKRVVITDQGFRPAAVTIRYGDGVRWVFAPRNRALHNVTAWQAPSNVPRRVFSSDRLMRGGDVFRRSFVKPGTYRFFCSLHPEMRMRVQVTLR